MDTDNSSSQNNNMNTDIPVSTVPPKRMGKILPITAIVVVIVLAVIILSYAGYIPISALHTSQSPYYSVSNVSQLAATAASIGSKSGPYNMSYSFTLGLAVNAGPIALNLNLPIKGYEAHYGNNSRDSISMDLGSLVNGLAAINKSIESSFPSALDTVNFSSIINSTGGSLCIPFSLLTDLVHTNASNLGFEFNDSAATNSSLLCIYLPIKNAAYNYSALGNEISGLSSLSPSLNSTAAKNISNKINKYITIKFVKTASYNGNACSLVSIASTNAFESKSNVSFSSSFCFSNEYGIALNGSFTFNITKIAGGLLSSLSGSNTSNSNLSVTNAVLTGRLSSSPVVAPVSASALTSLPAGSYTMNITQLTSLLFAFGSFTPPTIVSNADSVRFQ